MRKLQNHNTELAKQLNKWIVKNRKKLATFGLALLVPATLFGQVHFEQNLTWQQIKEKAKKENKYIFVDCYATWCGPCKQMDQEVYPNVALGEILNPLFISVKLQIDTSKKDDEQVKAWYPDAHQLSNEYHVNTLPTFLFFSSDGTLVRKANSFRPTIHFLKLALNATDQDKQEYALLAKYKEGKLPDSAVPALIKLLEGAGDNLSASEVARTYIDNYLLKLPEELLFKSDNISLMGKYLKSSDDKTFKLFYDHADQIDKSIAREGYAKAVIQDIIINEELLPRLWRDKAHKEPVATMPDWQGLHAIVQDKYGNAYADLSIDFERIAYYRKTMQWTELINAEVAAIGKDFFDAQGSMIFTKMERLNDLIYDHFFLHCYDKAILAKALLWEKQIVDANLQDYADLDTYANLLHKTGHRKEALIWEEKAIVLKTAELDEIAKAHKYSDRKKKELEDMKSNLQKIKTGKPTWIDVDSKN
ncbi:MAG: thioredoxin family protein [Bacteroidota bacterium]